MSTVDMFHADVRFYFECILYLGFKVDHKMATPTENNIGHTLHITNFQLALAQMSSWLN